MEDTEFIGQTYPHTLTQCNLIPSVFDGFTFFILITLRSIEMVMYNLAVTF